MSLARGRREDVVDRHVTAQRGHGRFVELTGAAEPLLHRAEERLVAPVLDRDTYAGEMRGQRSARENVLVVLHRVAVDDQPPIGRKLGIREALQPERLKALLAGFASRGARATALGAAVTCRRTNLSTVISAAAPHGGALSLARLSGRDRAARTPRTAAAARDRPRGRDG